MDQMPIIDVDDGQAVASGEEGIVVPITPAVAKDERGRIIPATSMQAMCCLLETLREQNDMLRASINRLDRPARARGLTQIECTLITSFNAGDVLLLANPKRRAFGVMSDIGQIRAAPILSPIPATTTTGWIFPSGSLPYMLTDDDFGELIHYAWQQVPGGAATVAFVIEEVYIQ